MQREIKITYTEKPVLPEVMECAERLYNEFLSFLELFERWHGRIDERAGSKLREINNRLCGKAIISVEINPFVP